MKILIFGDYDEVVFSCVVPNDEIVGLSKSNLTDVLGPWIYVGESFDEFVGDVLVEQKLHRLVPDTNLLSRSAAKARHARISSFSSSGKSLRIFSSDIPEARYSSTS
jgi:hypothetical protein